MPRSSKYICPISEEEFDYFILGENPYERYCACGCLTSSKEIYAKKRSRL